MEMVKGWEQAIASALTFVAPRGDEGCTVAFLGMQNSLLPGGTPAQKDNDDHLTALKNWMRDPRGGTSLEALGSLQRVYTLRSLVEPTAASLAAARAATMRSIQAALRMSDDRRGGSGARRGSEPLEGRALRNGHRSVSPRPDGARRDDGAGDAPRSARHARSSAARPCRRGGHATGCRHPERLARSRAPDALARIGSRRHGERPAHLCGRRTGCPPPGQAGVERARAPARVPPPLPERH